ncbi:MAG TPA: hypothetical protein VMP68_23950 [Candidatus Eisenbacteria bacterium]|nr:hypothetical protein [Candidatus Eisenbacteria bacterium]
MSEVDSTNVSVRINKQFLLVPTRLNEAGLIVKTVAAGLYLYDAFKNARLDRELAENGYR